MNKDNIKTEIIVKEQRINVLRIDKQTPKVPYYILAMI